MINQIKKYLTKEIGQIIKEKYNIKQVDNFKIGIPPQIQMGDLAIECFFLAKQLKKSPVVIAQELATKLTNNKFGLFTAVGPYLNITINNQQLFSIVCQTKINSLPSNKQIVMVEYLSPNTNKPLHVGHVRNGVIGMAISLILDFNGYKVIKANLTNDRGIHICKSMLAWQKFSEGATPTSKKQKGDHFVGDYYVIFAQKLKENPHLIEEAQTLLQEWEAGKPKVVALWKTMNKWVYAGFKETYKKFDFKFDVTYFESAIYEKGKDIVLAGLKKGLFKQKKDDTIYFPLSVKEFGLNKDGSAKKVTLLRANKTSVYATQDLATALQKSIDYDLNASVYVVAEEQEYYFKTLFSIFKTLKYSWAKHCHHLSYGMVRLTTGKMKSREGNVIDADDLLQEVIDLAIIQIKEKSIKVLTNKEITARATKIALGAIKFYLLKTNAKTSLVFDLKKSISFDGATGPYVQYAYTRAMNIIETAKKEGLSFKVDQEANQQFNLLGSNLEERLLAQRLLFFSEKIIRSASVYDPAIITNAVYELAKSFHQFYGKHHVVGEKQALASQRLALVQAVAQAIKIGLNLLGIETLVKM